MFYWGAATSAHQVEGGNHNDWTEWEIQTALEKAERAKKRRWPAHLLRMRPSPQWRENYICGRAADHYHRFRGDFDIAQTLGHTAHRFSIEWSRIEPEEGRWDEEAIAHYKEVIHALKLCNIEPFITLWHWTLPLWVRDRGGWRWRGAVERFARYAQMMARAYPEVTFWITVNEPEVYTFNSYVRGIWPPQQKGVGIGVMRALGRAHCRAYEAIKRVHPHAQVGIAKNNVFYEAADRNPWNVMLCRGADRIWNHWFLRRIARCQDFIGLNHYFHNRIRWGFNRNRNEWTSDLGWEVYPQSLYYVIRDLAQYRLPVYITESGIADARDIHRERYIRESIYWMKRAQSEGVDARGYFYWSLLDNFEWDKGFWPRFGLVEVDYRTYARTIRRSAYAYKEIIESSEAL